MAGLDKVKSSIKDKKELDYFLTHQERYKYVLKKIEQLNLPAGGRILDIGCYPPHMFRVLEERGYEVWGVASKHEPVKDKNVVSLNLETEKFPFKDQFFDLILFSEVIEHLIVDPHLYLPKFKKLLKKEGVFLITTPNAAHLKNRMKLLLGKSPSFSLQQLYETRPSDDSLYYRHNREFTGLELQQIIKDCGFKIAGFEFFSAYTPFREKSQQEKIAVKLVKIVGFLITQIFPKLRDSQYLLASTK